MRITRNHNEWHLDFANTLAERTVLMFAGFSLVGRVRYVNNYGRIDRQELMNELAYYFRMIRRWWKAML